ncbi:MAG: peptide chain release factor N(5)-glutamine methyltransferase [Eubacteriales bacterium]
MTYQQVTKELRLSLEEAQISDAAFEAQEILSFASNFDKNQLFRDYLQDCPRETEEKAKHFVEKRREGVPLPHLLGQWDFYGLTFFLNSHTLIPRLDTEVLIETALSLALPKENLNILDLCAGTGCIGITLGKQFPKSQVILGEISPPAMEICEKNIKQHNLSQTVQVKEIDALAPPTVTGFHLLVSNPPYISLEEMNKLSPDVREQEPHLALYGGEDGYDFYRGILKHWVSTLLPNGYLLFEVGFAQGEQVADMMRRAGLKDVQIHRDTNGNHRVIQGKCPCSS